MATLVWDQETDKKATYGVNHVVFWPKVKANKYSNENQAYGTPIAWSALLRFQLIFPPTGVRPCMLTASSIIEPMIKNRPF